MKKRYKLLVKNGKVHILHWETDGVLFGPDWECIAVFDDIDSNIERCQRIIRIMNECDKHKDNSENDGKRNFKG